MALNFPIQFALLIPAGPASASGGADSALEIAFQIEFDALRKLGPDVGEGETQMLQAFDRNRAAILKAAVNAYNRHRSNCYRLTAAEFSPQPR